MWMPWLRCLAVVPWGVLNDLVSLLVLASTMLFIEWRLGLLLLLLIR